MLQQQRNAEDIAVGNWEEILQYAGLNDSYLKYREGPCPICGGKERYRWKKKTETAFCNGCGFLSPFALLQHLRGTDFRGACDYIREWAGCASGSSPKDSQSNSRIAKPREVEAEPDDTDKLRVKYQRLWSEGFKIEPETHAFTYLTKRIPGLRDIPKVLRAHPSLAYWQMNEKEKFEKVGDYPAMLAIAQGLRGNAVNIHRTFLDHEGNKAPLADAKKTAGRFLENSYAIRLIEPEDELGIAEGIETALAVWILYGIPCWSTINAGGMKKFELPVGYERVKKLRIFADNDPRDMKGRRAGNDAAQYVKEASRAKGLIATVIMPRFTTFDFADIAKKQHA